VGAVAADVLGDLIVTGWGGSQDFPTTPDAYDPTYNGGATDAALARVRPDGNGADDLVYCTFLGGIGDDYGLALALGEWFEVTLAGSAGTMFPTTSGAFDETHNGGLWDVFGARLGSIGTTAIQDPPTALLPQWLRLGAPYPNPCNGPVSFAIEVTEQASVRVGVYDVSGRLVVRLMDRHLDTGSYDISWEPQAVTGGVPPGTYFLRLDAAGVRESRKIVLEP
jgi:hypothetical protein